MGRIFWLVLFLPCLTCPRTSEHYPTRSQIKSRAGAKNASEIGAACAQRGHGPHSTDAMPLLKAMGVLHIANPFLPQTPPRRFPKAWENDSQPAPRISFEIAHAGAHCSEWYAAETEKKKLQRSVELGDPFTILRAGGGGNTSDPPKGEAELNAPKQPTSPDVVAGHSFGCSEGGWSPLQRPSSQSILFSLKLPPCKAPPPPEPDTWLSTEN